MGKGLQMMLKALGIEIPPEHIAIIQALIPQLPAKINEAAQTINGALANFNGRLQALEIHAFQTREQLNRLEEILNGNPGGISDTTGSGVTTTRRGRRAHGGTGDGGNGSGS